MKGNSHRMIEAKMNWTKQKHGERFVLRPLSMNQICDEVPTLHTIGDMARILHNHAVAHKDCVMTYEEIGKLLKDSGVFPTTWKMTNTFVKYVPALIQLGVIKKEEN